LRMLSLKSPAAGSYRPSLVSRITPPGARATPPRPQGAAGRAPLVKKWVTTGRDRSLTSAALSALASSRGPAPARRRPDMAAEYSMLDLSVISPQARPDGEYSTLSIRFRLQARAKGAVMGVGVLVALGLWYVIARTKLGMLIRAGSDKREMVAALGVNIAGLFTLVFGLGALLAGLAGVLVGPIRSVQIGMGEQVLITTFVVIVVGGIGSIRGAFVGALVIGMCDTLSRAYAPMLLKIWLSGALADGLGAALSSIMIYLVMALVLVARPRGLFPAGG